MYPNPAQDELNFDLDGSAEITISAIDGRVIKSVTGVTTVDISDLPVGTYVVTVKGGSSVSSQKLIKN